MNYAAANRRMTNGMFKVKLENSAGKREVVGPSRITSKI